MQRQFGTAEDETNLSVPFASGFAEQPTLEVFVASPTKKEAAELGGLASSEPVVLVSFQAVPIFLWRITRHISPAWGLGNMAASRENRYS